MPEPYDRPAAQPAPPAGPARGPAASTDSGTAPRTASGITPATSSGGADPAPAHRSRRGDAHPARRRFPHLGRTAAQPPADPPRSSDDPPDPAPGVSGTARGTAARTRVRRVGEVREWPRSFAERLSAPRPGPGVRDLVRLVRECAVRPPQRALADAALLPVAPGPLPQAGPADVAVTWAGHASWVLRIGGLTVLTDPVWSRRIPGTPARITPVGVPWDALPPVDAVVVSHNHYDHLDAPTIRRLPRDTACFVPAGLGAWFRRRGFTRVTELDWWEAAEYRGVRFDFVPAHHWSRRTLTDLCRSLWGGWVLADGAGRRVYFAGDTGYGRCFADIGRAHPGIDLALLPIGAYAPRWMQRTVHTDPEEAVRAFTDLGAAAMAPMHWATFLLSGEPPLEPLLRLRAAWTAAGLPEHALWDLPVGGSRVL